MHTAAIDRVAVDPAGKFLVTASEDKTIRVWQLPSGTLSVILRPPTGPGKSGVLYATALSPDGATIAAGGNTRIPGSTGYTIYLFSRESGSITGRITTVPSTITHLAYSPDGRFLAVTMVSGGIRLYRCADGSLAGADSDYAGTSYSAHFSKTGRLVTTCVDGTLRIYQTGDNGLTLLLKKKAPGKGQPYAARFSPDGTMIAVGHHSSRDILVFSAQDLSLLFTPDTKGVSGKDLAAVAWSEDGHLLFAAGDYYKKIGGVWKSVIRVWENGGRGRFRDRPAAGEIITDMVPTADGGVVFGSTDPAFGVLDRAGKTVLASSSAIADFRNNRERFFVSADGTTVQFAYMQGGKTPAVFDARSGELTLGSAPSGRLLSPLTAPLRALTVTDWQNTHDPKVNGHAIRLKPGEMSRAFAIAPDHGSFVLASDRNLRRIDGSGKTLWEVPLPRVAWAVNIAGNGKVILAAVADGTIRWYRMSDGEAILVFFPHADKKRWALWTPSGYYSSSPEGTELLGWHRNNGHDQAATLHPAEEFRALRRPDVTSAILSTLDETEALRLADQARIDTISSTP